MVKTRQKTPRPKQSNAFRSSLTKFSKALRDLKLTAKHVRCLQKTPFWPLFNSILTSKVVSKKMKKYDVDIIKVIETYDPHGEAFNIGGKTLKLTEEHIDLIFGIVSGPKTMKKEYGAKPVSRFLQRRGLDTLNRLQAPKLRAKLIEAGSGEEQHDCEDFARLCCLYLFVTLLFSNAGQTLGWAYCKYVESLEEMKQYAWSKAVKNTVIRSLNKYHKHPTSVSGCLLLLMYWLCENTNIVQPDMSNKFPRFLKWDLGELHIALKNKDLRNLGSMRVKTTPQEQTKYNIAKLEWELEFEPNEATCEETDIEPDNEEETLKVGEEERQERWAIERFEKETKLYEVTQMLGESQYDEELSTDRLDEQGDRRERYDTPGTHERMDKQHKASIQLKHRTQEMQEKLGQAETKIKTLEELLENEMSLKENLEKQVCTLEKDKEQLQEQINAFRRMLEARLKSNTSLEHDIYTLYCVTKQQERTISNLEEEVERLNDIVLEKTVSSVMQSFGEAAELKRKLEQKGQINQRVEEKGPKT